MSPFKRQVDSPRRQWLPAALARGSSHVLVDGAVQPGAVLALSHWPKSGTPAYLRADTSTEIVLAWMKSNGELPANIVATDHLDQDGLAAAWALLHESMALHFVQELIGLATCGDFAVVTNRKGARASFALATLADAKRSPLQSALFARNYSSQTLLGRELLDQVTNLITNVDGYRSLWIEEDDHFEYSKLAVNSGEVLVEEVDNVDLAVIDIPIGPVGLATRFFRRSDSEIHPAAIYSATNCSRVLVRGQRRFEFTYRYESWVEFSSRRVPARVDLQPLVTQLNSEETGPATWRFSGCEAALAVMDHTGLSDLKPQRVQKLCEEALLRGDFHNQTG